MDFYRPQKGTPVSELETPCFIVDMDALESNFRVIADTYRNTAVKMREHTKNLKSPFIAKLQIDIGGTNGGVCTAKVSEAEVMVQGGIKDILIPNQIVTDEKIARLCALAKVGDMKVCVDNERNVRDIARVASANGVTIGILIEIDTDMHRAGVRTSKHAVELAKLASSLPGVAFRGVMSHQTIDGWPDKETRYIVGRKFFDICMEAVKAIEKAGMPVEIVSSGETYTYDLATEIPGVTEVEGGTYALMDVTNAYMTEFQMAGMLLATVVSAPRPGVAVADIGTRAICPIKGYWPKVAMKGVTIEELHSEHMVLKLDAGVKIKAGDKLTVHPGYQDGLVNRWDQFIAIRGGQVEAVYDIPGRGCFY
ncbi:MAG: hypothetical protein FJ319_14460 [SAR202 cluster bacterium]|nr:hypothetical protein [SAR202 cluster bacterium]